MYCFTLQHNYGKMVYFLLVCICGADLGPCGYLSTIKNVYSLIHTHTHTLTPNNTQTYTHLPLNLFREMFRRCLIRTNASMHLQGPDHNCPLFYTAGMLSKLRDHSAHNGSRDRSEDEPGSRPSLDRVTSMNLYESSSTRYELWVMDRHVSHKISNNISFYD